MVNVTIVVVASTMIAALVLLVKNHNLNTALEKQLQINDADKQTMLDEHTRDTTRYNTLRIKAITSEEAVQSMEQKLKEETNNNMRLNADVENKVDTMNQLRAEINQLKTDIGQQDLKAQEAQNEIANVKAKLESQTNDLSHTQDENNKNLASLKEYESKYKDLVDANSKLSNVMQENEKLEKLKAELQQENEKLKAELQQKVAAPQPEQKNIQEAKRSIQDTAVLEANVVKSELPVVKNSVKVEDGEIEQQLNQKEKTDAREVQSQKEEALAIDKGKEDPQVHKKDENQAEEEKDEDVVEGDGDVVEGDEDVVEGDEDVVEGNEDVVEGDEDPSYNSSTTMSFKVTGDVVEGDEDVVEGDEDVVEGDEDVVEGDEDVVEGNEDVVEGDEDPSYNSSTTMSFEATGSVVQSSSSASTPSKTIN